MFKITVDFKDAQKFKNFIRSVEDTSKLFTAIEGGVTRVADTAVNKMKETIEDNRKNPARPGNKLENSIDWEQLINQPGKSVEIGIGNIATMTQAFAYWELINDGGTYVTKATHKVPTEFFGNDVNQPYIHKDTPFVTFAAGSAHTIEGIDFVGKALRHIESNLDKELKLIMAAYIEGMKKASTTGNKSTYVKAWGKNVRFGPPGSGGFSGSAR